MEIKFINSFNKKDELSAGKLLFLTLIPTICLIYCSGHSNKFSKYSEQLIISIKWLSFEIQMVIKPLKVIRANRNTKQILSKNKMMVTNTDATEVVINGNKYITPFGFYIGKDAINLLK